MTPMTRRALGAVVAAVAVFGLAACGGSSSSNSSGTPSTGGSSDLAKQCPTDALAKATKPVKITYWHAMERANEDALKKITKEFNARDRHSWPPEGRSHPVHCLQ